MFEFFRTKPDRRYEMLTYDEELQLPKYKTSLTIFKFDKKLYKSFSSICKRCNFTERSVLQHLMYSFVENFNDALEKEKALQSDDERKIF